MQCYTYSFVVTLFHLVSIYFEHFPMDKIAWDLRFPWPAFLFTGTCRLSELRASPSFHNLNIRTQGANPLCLFYSLCKTVKLPHCLQAFFLNFADTFMDLWEYIENVWKARTFESLVGALNKWIKPEPQKLGLFWEKDRIVQLRC